ncbi:MAG: hypothetical protein HZC50_01440 [Nitrospirae bacterium]|nr:hypothetical protein [Nitrospirota bacterium]
MKPSLLHRELRLNDGFCLQPSQDRSSAILIEKVGDEYRQTYRGEAPTTVEAPFEDVTHGVLNAIAEIKIEKLGSECNFKKTTA